MARIKFGPNVTDIRGSIGNVVYSIWKAGVNYIRMKPNIISNPKSADQVAIRQLVAASSARWFTELTSIQRASWEEMAQRLASITGGVNGQGGILNIIPPVGGIMSGVNAYVSFRAAAFTAGFDPLLFIDNAPLGEDQPLNVTALNVTYDNISLIFTWLLPVPIDPGAVVRVWLRSRELVYHRQLANVEPAASLGASFDSAKSANGNPIVFSSAIPQHILVQVDVVNPSGYRSPGGETLEIITT